MSHRLDPPTDPAWKPNDYTVTVAGGRSVRIGAGAPKGSSLFISATRHDLFWHFGAKAAYVGLGGVNDRHGGLIAPTLRGRFLEGGQLALELAVGPYAYADGNDNGQPRSGVEAAFLATVAWRLLPEWEVNATVGRFAGFKREEDYDLLTFGLGYLFGT